jgi:hypothetical protein
MSELESLGGEVADAIERVRVPAYVIDRHGIIRWLNPAARKLVGTFAGATSPLSPHPRSRGGHGRSLRGTFSGRQPARITRLWSWARMASGSPSSSARFRSATVAM